MSDQTKHVRENPSPTISVAMIIKNEAANLDAFFVAIQGLADEIIVGYSPSTDGTMEKIHTWQQKGLRVHIVDCFEKPFHWGRARNQTLEAAEGDYVFVLDADERPDAYTKEHLREVLAEHRPYALELQREDDLVPHYIDMQKRIFRNHSGIRYASDFDGQMDEQPILMHGVERFSGKILHLQGDRHWLKGTSRFAVLAQDVARRANTKGFFRECVRGILAFLYKFRQIYFRKNARYDGWNGFRFAFMRSWFALLLHIKVGLKPREEA
jgi:(heptosyl)LPS beta-1,4-glucosyltransferase